MTAMERLSNMQKFTYETIVNAVRYKLSPSDLMASIGTILDYLEATVEGFTTEQALVCLLQCARDVHNLSDEMIGNIMNAVAEGRLEDIFGEDE